MSWKNYFLVQIDETERMKHIVIYTYSVYVINTKYYHQTFCAHNVCIYFVVLFYFFVSTHSPFGDYNNHSEYTQERKKKKLINFKRFQWTLWFCCFVLLFYCPFLVVFFSLLSLENRFSFHSYWSRAVKMTLLIWFQRNRLSSHIISTNPNLSDEQIEWRRPRSNR